MGDRNSKDPIWALKLMFNRKSFDLVGKRAQLIKVLVVKPDHPSSTPQTHMVERELIPLSCPLSCTRALWRLPTHIHTSCFLHETEHCNTECLLRVLPAVLLFTLKRDGVNSSTISLKLISYFGCYFR